MINFIKLVVALNISIIAELRDPVLKPIFNQIDQQMDRMANITYFVGAKLSFLVIGTTDAIVTSVNYFIKDMGDESYFLASPLL